MTVDSETTEKRSRLSPAKLALLEKRLRGEADDDSFRRRIPRRQQENALPLSFAQQRLWFLDQLEPGSAAYNISTAFRHNGALDLVALNRAINVVVSRHEILRTSFSIADREPVQVVDETLICDLPFVDLGNLPADNRQAEVRRLATEHARQPFDLTEAPLFRLCLLRLSETEHILLLTIHHIISDAWSLDIFLREMTEAYASNRDNHDAVLAKPPVQYADFSIWQRQWAAQRGLEQQLVYWRKQLADAPEALDLPTDKPRPQPLSFAGAQQAAEFPRDLIEGLRRLSKQENVTLFMLLLAAFNALLARYSGQEDILLGSPIAGRNRMETESLIGLFVNTLVLRTDLSGNPSLRELLRRTKENTLAAHANQDLPFEKLVEELQPARGVGHSPFFQVMLDFKSASGSRSQRGGWQIENLELDRGTARADLLLFLTEEENSLSCLLEYSTDLFEPATMQRLLRHFEVLLADVVGNPDQRVSELSLLTEKERQQLLVEWNQIRPSTDYALCIQQLFEQQVARTPDAVAIVFEAEQLTYAELNRKANQLAHYLRRRGVGPEVLVGVCLERSIQMVVGLLGILKAGGAYLPLDPSYPAERLAFMLEDAGVDVLVAQQELLKKLQPSVAEIVRIDADWDQALLESGNNPESETAGENVAYVIYTSGSTGKPKGVIVTHSNVVRLFEATDSSYKFTANDVWTLFHSYAFDFSVWEIWGALFYGGRLVIVPYLVSRAPEDFYELLCREKVTVLNQTPSAFRQLIEAEASSTSPDRLSLREVIFGGEALDFQSLAPWFKRHGDIEPRLVNMYGITETTVHVTYRPLSGTDVEKRAGSRIGRPLDDLQVYILDRAQQLAPIGVPGEMYVGGRGVARGYLNRPELTAERFVPNPFGEPGARLYRTGDLARVLPSGDIEYLGRVDRQVKVRGFRIELGEIESVLAQHEMVRDCLVLARQDSGDQQLVAYVIAETNGSPSVESARSFLKDRLPPYMVPASFVLLDHFPLTLNGKIDERALPLPEKSRPDLADAFVAPRTEIETRLANLWHDVLGREEIGVHDNFFDLGGHSLLATQVIARIREQFHTNLPLRYFFERPTVAGLGEFLRDAKEENRDAMPEIKRLPRAQVSPSGSKHLNVATGEAVYPLSAMQQGMLLHSIYDPNGGAYIQQMVCELREPIDVTVLNGAWRQAVERHGALRTSFRWEGLAEPIQEVSRAVALPFSSEDWSDLTPGMQEQKIIRYLNDDRRSGFEASEAPLMRVALFKLGEGDYRMIWTFHHALLDGRSHFLVLKEVFETYDACVKGEEKIPREPRPYSEYIEWLAKQDLAKAEVYWRQALHGFRSPTDLRLPVPSAGEQGHATQGMRLSPELTSELRSLAQRNQFTLNNLVQAGWSLLLSRYSGKDDVLFGATRACRHWTSEGAESMVGLYINTLPFRVQLSDQHLLEWLRALRAQHVALREYEHTPLMKAQAWSETLGGTPLFDSVLVFENYQMNSRLNALGERWSARSFTLLEQTNYPLTLAAYASDDLLLKLEYDQQRFEATSIERMLKDLQALLVGIAANPDLNVRELSLAG